MSPGQRYVLIGGYVMLNGGQAAVFKHVHWLIISRNTKASFTLNKSTDMDTNVPPIAH